MNDIIDLIETTPNHWRAKYQGNYGVYTIKIETDGKKRGNFSCSCPSDYHPCKHIAMVESAIHERIAKNAQRKESGMFENVVKGIPQQDLQNFIIRFGLHNSAFQQAVLLEFATRQKQTAENDSINYSQIIREGLEDIYFDDEDYYDYQYNDVQIDILDEWLAKARQCIEEKEYAEAVLIAKACLEEYAEWASNEMESEYSDYIPEDYSYEPVNILKQAKANGYLSAKELLDYCRCEAQKKKYESTGIDGELEELILELTNETDPEAYIALLDKELKQLSDKSSYVAENLLKRKIKFYQEREEAEKAWKIIEGNIQIESFRKQAVEKFIAGKKHNEAKKLINDFLKTKESNDSYYGRRSEWDDYLLQIAQDENDKDEIRRLSKGFIEGRFDLKYYNIFKSTFSADAWPAEIEKLVKKYQVTGGWFYDGVAEVFIEEKLTGRFLTYLTHNANADNLERYYKHVAPQFPKETLDLFKQTIDNTMKNTGRNVYERTTQLFKLMLDIEGGKDIVRQMIANYKIQYRNRKAMVEILDGFESKKL